MSTSDNTATNSRDVYSRVTAQIINSIEMGVGMWRMPWHTSGRYAFSPINATSKKPYRGINTVGLWSAAQATLTEPTWTKRIGIPSWPAFAPAMITRSALGPQR
jgi:antirestriction protein ArdC